MRICRNYVLFDDKTDIYEKYEKIIKILDIFGWKYEDAFYYTTDNTAHPIPASFHAYALCSEKCTQIQIRTIHWNTNVDTLHYMRTAAFVPDIMPDSVVISSATISLIISVHDTGMLERDILDKINKTTEMKFMGESILTFLTEEEKNIPVIIPELNMPFPCEEIIPFVHEERKAPCSSLGTTIRKFHLPPEFECVQQKKDAITLKHKNKQNHISLLQMDYTKDSRIKYAGTWIYSAAVCMGYYQGVNFKKRICSWIHEIRNQKDLEEFMDICISRWIMVVEHMDSCADEVTALPTPEWFDV